jgi:predicted enzyme related to lactoylglutathione lyase
MPLPASASLQAFILTPDRAVALPFYRDVLGLAVLAEDPYAATLDLGGGATLRLTDHAGWEPTPHTVIGWVVEDIAAALDSLAASGVACEIYEGFGQDERGIWHGPGAKVAWFKDPVGNLLSYTQMGG